jgi:prolyl oligopeptidase
MPHFPFARSVRPLTVPALQAPVLAIALFIAACGGDQGAGTAVVELPKAPTKADYPVAERSDHVDEYHGVEIADPYRWMEEMESEAVEAWVEAENAVSFPYLASLPARDPLKDRITQLWNYERFGQPREENGRYFFTRNDGLQDQSVLYVSEGLDGTETHTLIDPNGFSEDATIALSQYSVSRDGEMIAYSTSDGGSDWKTWHVRVIDTGEDTDDFLDFTKFSGASWALDGSGFYYSRYPVGEDGKGDGSKSVSIYFHRLGDAQSADELVYSIPDHPRRNPYASVTEDGRYLVIRVSERNTENGIYYRDLEDPSGEVVKLLDEWDALYSFTGNDGSTFFVRTNRDAPRWRLVAIDLADPAPENWREVVPQVEETLSQASYVGGYITTRYLKDVQTLVRIYRPDGSHVRDVELPGVGSAFGFGGDADRSATFFTFSGFTTPGRIYRYDVETGETTLWRESEVPGFDASQYETTQVFVRSADGTRVPMFITHKRGIELDGTNPTLLYGYGGFNISLTPGFNVGRVAWMERGGVLAIPNLRGGGEYGEEWHRAGTKLEKQNVFDDFIAAAEWLIENGYTSPEKLAIQGGSNGGLLVGAALTQRPDLFGVALPAVGVMDMLRYHTASANARAWSGDYGLSENEDEFRAQLAYSPVHNAEEGVCYPPTLVTTADHDDRVVPWHSFKFGAALQHAQSCDNPVLVRVETRAGHGAGKPTWMRIEEIADQWAFLEAMLGVGTGE